MTEPHTPPNPSSPSRPSTSPRSSKRPAPVLARWQFENQASTTDTVPQPRKVGRLSIPPSPLPTTSNPSTPTPTPEPSMAAAAPQPPPISTSLSSDASDLADHIQNLSLDDTPAPLAKPDVSDQPEDVSTQISHIAEAIASLRSIVFEVEEKRHAGAAIADLEMTMIQIDTNLESISTSIQKLESQVQSQDNTVLSPVPTDDDDDDDDTFDIPGIQTPSAAAQSSSHARFQQLNSDWTALQQDTETLKRELTDDKYVAHFNTASKQAESLIDSLAKALTICSTFVNEFHSNGGRVPLSDDEDDNDEQHNAKQLQRLHSVLSSFQTKRSYYTPACQQTFAAFDRSLKERSTANGALLRNFADLKKRWKQIKEDSARMDKELRRIESHLTGGKTAEAQSPQPPLPIKSSLRSVSGPSTSRRPPSTTATTRNGTGMSSSPSTGSLPASAAAASLSSSSSSSSRHNRSISIQPTSSNAATSSRTRPPSTSALSRSLGPSSYDSPSKRNSSNLTPSKPPSAYRPNRFGSGNLGSPSDRETALRARSKTPQPAGSTSMLARNFRSGTEPPEVPRIPSAYRPQPPKQGPRGDGDEDSMEYMDPAADLSLEEPPSHSRPGSAMSTSAQPQFPLHYRPPSALGSHLDDDTASAVGTPRTAKRQSRIPTYTFPNNSAHGNPDNNRPSSSLSQTSTTRLMGHHRGPSRSTMQTPEPMIAARVKRLSMYAKPSTGGNVPSTSKRASAAYPSSTPSALGSSRPPSASYRWSTAGGGRTTPLSASALAKVPHAGPVSLPGGNGGNQFGGATSSSYAHSNASGSVANFRASRQQALRPHNTSTPTHYSSSIRDGANTPTFSEGGMSSFSGIASSRLYRPNPNDILDVSISNITNALGIPLTRIDDPLPRGMKTETGPGKEIRGRYSFGGTGTVMMCKLLELHRPASIYGAVGGIAQGGKQRKVLVKVPGKGFLDLELWLLSAFETEGGSQMN